MNSSNKISSRQRAADAINHKITDRVPVDMWWTDETAAKLESHFGVKGKDELRNALGLDIVWLWAEYNGPSLKNLGTGTVGSYWGFISREAYYNGGKYMELCHNPLAEVDSLQQIDDYPWPNPDHFDYSALPGRMAHADKGGEKWIGVGESSIFERSWALVGMQQFMQDLLVQPDIPSRIMEHVNNFYIEQTLRTLRACNGRADMVYLGDDIGSQNGMLLSPTVWRNMIKPLQKKLNDAILAEFPDIKFHYHSCGSIVPIIDDLIEIGIDILNPIQPKARGMQAEFLAEKWGERLTFLGGLDTQELLPRGTANEVHAECIRLIRTLCKGGGYVLAPAHAVQADVPIENILAITEAAKNIGTA